MLVQVDADKYCHTDSIRTMRTDVDSLHIEFILGDAHGTWRCLMLFEDLPSMYGHVDKVVEASKYSTKRIT